MFKHTVPNKKAEEKNYEWNMGMNLHQSKAFGLHQANWINLAQFSEETLWDAFLWECVELVLI